MLKLGEEEDWKNKRNKEKFIKKKKSKREKDSIDSLGK